jgi:hypothetical protein
MGRSSLGLALAAALLAGCGADENRSATTTTQAAAPTAPKVRCAQAQAPGFRLCMHAGDGPPRVRAAIQRRKGDGWSVLTHGPPGTMHDGVQVGHWEQAWLSPDGETLLAYWSAECEVPFAFFVDARTGQMRVVTGEKVWFEAPESVPLGWVADGRARVRLPKGACGTSAARPAVYLIDPETGRLTRQARE